MLLVSKLLPVFFFFPLGIVIVLLAVSLFLLKKRMILVVQILLGVILSILFLLSTEIVSFSLIKGLERRYPAVDIHAVKADAIVVLGGGGRPKIHPRSHVEFNEGGERMFHGLRLFKAGAAPVVIVTGGGIDFILKGQCEGADMKELMVEFGMPPDSILIEGKARNTFENAVFTGKLMDEGKIARKIILVTSACHMPRSVAIFKKAGFEVIPAPADFLIEDKAYNWFSLLPMAGNFFLSTQAIKEWAGILAYRVLGRL